MRRELSEGHNVADVWDRAIAEDVSLLRHEQREGWTVVPVPDAMTSNVSARDIRELWRWYIRQVRA
ncbi:MAG: cellulose synthase/poly-beta-1,6-N-acetylglucosamine synthase-like glycosyltransferase [Kiritimatiellia bacterium]|jgi:cellulose synthase/poly-beta-1,6-N-acetylglucosamine synthase-like glycosyltransferase